MNDVGPLHDAPPGLDPPTVQAISDWLVDQGLHKAPHRDVVSGFCERLLAAGLPLLRTYIVMRTLHPTLGAFAIIWRRGMGASREEYPLTDEPSPMWVRSPLRTLAESDTLSLRRRIVGPGAERDYAVLDDLRALGATDYYLRKVAMAGGAAAERPSGAMASFTTDRPGGFSDADIAVLDRLLPRLALSLAATLDHEISATLLDTYVGAHAGRRILSGEITRGSVSAIGAVLWYADLRDFTAVSGALDQHDIVAMLNGYFDCMAEPVTSRGGEVLKFLGDGMLAIFQVDNRPTALACVQALAAATAAVGRVRALNDRRSEAGHAFLELDVALHVGEVLFGNVGTANRLDFTVIGAAVNEASRIEQMCRTLGRPILASEAFRAAAGEAGRQLVGLGRHRLRGVDLEQELFTVGVPPAA